VLFLWKRNVGYTGYVISWCCFILVLLGRTPVQKAEVTVVAYRESHALPSAVPSVCHKRMGHWFKLCLPIAAMEIPWPIATLVGSS